MLAMHVLERVKVDLDTALSWTNCVISLHVYDTFIKGI